MREWAPAPPDRALLRGLGRLRQRRKLVLRIDAGLHDARRHDQRHCLLDGNVESDHVAARHVEEETGGRIRRARHESRHMLGLRQLRGDRRAWRMAQEHQRPHARRREFNEAYVPEARIGAGEQRLEDLLGGAVDRPHDRHTVQQALAETDEPAADQICSEKSKESKRDESDDQAEAGNVDRQIGLGTIGDRNQRPHQIIHPGDEPPDQPQRHRHRPGDDQPGQKVIADAADKSVRRSDRGCGRASALAAIVHRWSDYTVRRGPHWTLI